MSGRDEGELSRESKDCLEEKETRGTPQTRIRCPRSPSSGTSKNALMSCGNAFARRRRRDMVQVFVHLDFAVLVHQGRVELHCVEGTVRQQQQQLAVVLPQCGNGGFLLVVGALL